jgi:transcriptional regulator with XRE-family HTH domain
VQRANPGETGEAMTTFGAKLRALMAERQISQRKLAKLVPCDDGHLSKIANDRKNPSPKLAARLDELLDAKGSLAVLARSSSTRTWTDGPITPDDAERLLLAARRPARADSAVVEALATVLAGQRRLEDRIGAMPLIPTACAQLQVVDVLVSDARGSIRPNLVDIASQWAQFAAWLHAACRRLADADRLYERAIVWATEADSPDMVATAWNMKGHTAWMRGEIGPMISLSQVAARDRRASPGVRALAAQQQARGHAIAGDADAMDRQLDIAHELTLEAAAHSDEEPPWIYFFDARMLTLQRARAYLYLEDRTEAAVELLETGLAEMAEEVQRSEWLAHYIADLARAYRTLHENDEADRLVADIDQVATLTGSEALARRVTSLR